MKTNPLWDVVESRTGRAFDGPFRTRDAAHAVAMEATRAARERGSPLSYWPREHGTAGATRAVAP